MLNKKKGLNKFTTIFSLSLIFIFILLIFIFGKNFNDIITNLELMLFNKFHFLFFLSINIVTICLIFLALSKYGKIKIGGEDAKIEYSTFSWYSMLFSAGMGIGIMFYSVAQPLSHYDYSPLFISSNKTISSLATTYFSWGIHAWVVYALIGLSFGYFAYNKKLPLALRSIFYPVLKNKIYGRVGDIIDSLGAIITLFALSSSLSLGSIQINSGLNYLLNIKVSELLQILIIIIIILIATISVISGLDKGVRILSNINMKLAIFLGVALLILGPTILIFKNFFLSSALYITSLIPASIKVNYVDISWSNHWPIFYMSWWISWSIFVGMFIAKISKGRTIKQYIISIIVIPTFISMIWFCIMGSNAIFVDNSGVLTNLVNKDVSLSLFAMIDLLVNNVYIKIGLQILSFIIIIFFFITSSDSGSLIINSLINKDDNNNFSKVFWSLIQGLLAIVIIMAGGIGAIELIQNLLIIISLPLTVLLIYILIVTIYSIRKDHKKDKENN